MTGGWRNSETLAERLERNSIPEPNSGCRLWCGSLDAKGYGGLAYQGRRLRAHRASYEANHGPIPAGMDVCHKCDVRSCIEDTHLFLGTNLDNVLDKVAKGRGRNGAKLQAKDIPAIRADRRTLKVIAQEYGVGISQLSRIKNGESWSHVGGL
jgi:hypothetical protein